MRDQDWDIKARSEACVACEKPYEDGQAFFSKLTHGEEGYVRGDFCEACWEGVEREGSLSMWKGVFKKPPPPQEEALKKETAEALLRRMVETEDPANTNTIYILAVMLERRRILIEKDVQTRDDGVKVRVYEHRHTGDVFLIPDPELKLAELEHVQEEVVVMLGGKPREPEVSDQSAEVSDDDDEVDENEDDEDEDEDEE